VRWGASVARQSGQVNDGMRRNMVANLKKSYE
jgi:hypothetical protein